jgi:hypothetical protein
MVMVDVLLTVIGIGAKTLNRIVKGLPGLTKTTFSQPGEK